MDENKMTDLVNTKLDVRSLMAIDYSLAESAGLKKIHTAVQLKSLRRVQRTPKKEACLSFQGNMHCKILCEKREDRRIR